jgi:hypothetical protein
MENGFWIALVIGGVVVGTLSLLYQLYGNKDGVKPKAIARDFIFGSFFSALGFHFMPETMNEMFEKGKDSIQAMASAVPAASTVADIDLHTGPARF